MGKRRAVGAGSMFFNTSMGLWIGQREIVRPRGQKRQTRRVSSKTFCGMLTKFSALADDVNVKPMNYEPDKPSRRELVKNARARGTHTRAEWIALVAAQDGKCFYCAEKPRDPEPRMIMGQLRYLTVPLTKDHKIPLIRGGSDAITNIVGACLRCNNHKGTMTTDEYLAFRRQR